MGECLLTRRGGSSNEDNLTESYGIILVNYPEGGICTCTLYEEDGETIIEQFTAGNTYGGWAFGIPTAGAWVVGVHDPEDSLKNKKTVEITTEGQSEQIDLVYALTLYKSDYGVLYDGSFQAAYRHAYSSYTVNDTCLQVTDYYDYGTGAEGVMRTTVPIDLTHYDYLVMTPSSVSGIGNAYLRPRFGVWQGSRTSFTVEFDSYVGFTATNKENYLDISELEGEYYIGFAIGAGMEESTCLIRVNLVELR